MVNLNHYPSLLSRGLEIAMPVLTNTAELAKAQQYAQRLGTYCQENKYVRVPFVGDFSAGKSTLLNTFLGEDVLPTNILPETAVSYELFYAPEPKLEHYRGGSLLGTTSLEAIKSLSTLPGDIVRVYMPNSKLLDLQTRGIILVDMPGIDSGIKEHQEAISNYLEHGSHFVMLLDAEQGSLRSSTLSFMNELVQYKIALSVLISKCDKKPAADVEQIRALVEKQCAHSLSQAVTVGTCSSVLNSFASLEQILSSVDVEGAIRKKLEAPCYGYINGLVSGLTSRAGVLMTNTSDLDSKLAQIEADKAQASAALQEQLRAEQSLTKSVDDILADVRQALTGKAQYLATVCFQNKGNQDIIQSEFISIIRPVIVNAVQRETEVYQATLGAVLQDFTAKGSSSFSIDKVLGDLLLGLPLDKLLVVQLAKLSTKLLARGGKYVMMLGRGLAFLASGPVVGLILSFIFTKMDKKSKDEQTKILRAAQDLLAQQLSRSPEFIMAISAANPQAPECRTLEGLGISFEQIIKPVLQAIKPEPVIKILEHKVLEDLEVHAISELNVRIDRVNQELKTIREQGKDLFKSARSERERLTRMEECLNEVLGASYDELDKCNDAVFTRLDAYETFAVDAINREYDWEDKVGFFSDASSLVWKRDAARKRLENLQQEGVPKLKHYWDKEARTALAEVITSELKTLIERVDFEEAEHERGEELLLKFLRIRKEQLEKIEALHKSLPTALRADYQAMLKFFADMAQSNRIEQKKPKSTGDLFSAIAEDDWLTFRSLVSEGVDLEVCNAEGYSPLTWAARHGNNQIISFLIAQEVKLSLADAQGRTALSVAVEQHYQDICQLLLQKDPSLADGLNLIALSRQNQFEAYLSTLQ